MLEARGIETQICTFSKTTSMTNLKQLWALFADVNICIGASTTVWMMRVRFLICCLLFVQGYTAQALEIVF